MGDKYEKYINQWNNIFSKETFKVPTNKSCGNETLDKGIKWVSNNTNKILDFGCGNGTMLFLCALNGTKTNIGIDLSEVGINLAKKRAEKMIKGKFHFMHGGINVLKDIEDSSIDAVILSNIVDNLYPEDAKILMNEVKRILNNNGKLLIKLNSYISKEQIEKLDIKVIEENVYDDGMILWNNTTEKWKEFFEKGFYINHYEKVYFPKYNQYNRMFLLVKKH